MGDHYARVQRRLLERGQFQMKQTVVLQEDELDRLRDRLRDLRSTVAAGQSRLNHTNTQQQQRIHELTSELRRVNEKHSAAVDQLYSEHRSRVSTITGRHSREVAELKEKYAKLTRRSLERSASAQEELTEIVSTVPDEAQEIARKTEKKVNKTEAKLAVVKEQIRKSRRRTSEVMAQIDKAREEIENARGEAETKVPEIHEQAHNVKRAAKGLKSEYVIAVQKMEESECEPMSLVQLRERVEIAKENLRVKKEQLEQRRRASAEKLEDLEFTRAKCELSRFEGTVDTSRVDSLAKRRLEEGKIIAQLREKVREYDPDLKALREENLDLLRKVAEEDYAVHGRKGLHQRFSRVTGVSQYSHDLNQ
jgi:myosin protein heavy chain